MADQPVASKAAKQNQKRRARKKNKVKTRPDEEPTADLSHQPPVTARESPPPPPPPLDPVRELKKQIEAAKAEKDHEKTQMLRQQLWAIQDTLATGTTGPGAPQIDPSLIQPQSLPVVTKSTDPMMMATVDILEKKISKLRKKLQQIEELKNRRTKGEKLEKNQMAKIETESEILDEISALEAEMMQNQLR